MTNYPLGWQSWSPPTPHWSHLPQWDYNPFETSSSYPLQKPSRKPKSPISLWCSWHTSGTNIGEKLILDQAKKFKTHKYVPGYILIDDGWCLWGDWITPSLSQFPHGIASLTRQLSQLNYQTGLWIAPFLVSPNSSLVHDHPNWIIKDLSGKPFNGFVSYPIIKDFTPKYILDITLPSVQGYLYSCLDTMVNDWGVTLLKLDHLYAPYFAPNPTIAKQAETALISLFQYIRTKYPDVYTMACGCPFEPAQNLVDAIRISKDINSPSLNSSQLLGNFLYRKRKKLLYQKLAITQNLSPLPFGLDPDAAITLGDADHYYPLWQSGQIQVFSLGYNL